MKRTPKFNGQPPFEDQTGCYQAINDFFDSFSIPVARRYILSALKAAESDRIWNKGGPMDLLYLFERLEALLMAASSTAKNVHKNEATLIPKPAAHIPDITQFEQYCGTYDFFLAWDYFPRTLNIKEYCDPYKALKKASGGFSKNEWKQILEYIKSYALCANSLVEVGIELEILHISRLLQKTLEASHLIYVRMNLQRHSTK